MVNKKRVFIIVLALLAGLSSVLWIATALARSSAQISGMVYDAEGPVAGARVRVRATSNLTLSDSMGKFTLSGLEEGKKIEISTWKDGYYIASTYVTPTISGDISLILRPYHTTDHPDYEWIEPTPQTSDTACGNCHPMILPQWSNNAHGEAISNARFFSLYNGTNLSGTLQIAPGYTLDFPGTDGVCASCHAPGTSVDGYLTTNMNAVRAQITAGIHCDFCHKIGGAYLDPATGSPYPNAPGMESIRMLRPPEGEQIFFGPYDDIHDPDTYLPLTTESQFCAACHQVSFWGTPIYESFNEWLASPYAEADVTCQVCHMPPNGDTHFALPEVGGLEHPAETIPSHLQLGAASQDMLENTVSMDVIANQMGTRMLVSVTITNTNAGHHVPTDFPGRHMILTVSVRDQGGQELPLLEGPLVPDWGGAQANLPGTAYAKILRDVQSGEAPVVSYWKQTVIISDNRIPALDVVITEYAFQLPKSLTQVQISAQLVLRRVFQDLADEKGWDTPDMLMEQVSFSVAPETLVQVYLPLMQR